MAVNRGAGVETASTMWAVVKWDVFYGASYFLMVFSDNLVSIWVDKQIVDSDKVNMLALTLFIVATAGLESMMMVSFAICLLELPRNCLEDPPPPGGLESRPPPSSFRLGGKNSFSEFFPGGGLFVFPFSRGGGKLREITLRGRKGAGGGSETWGVLRDDYGMPLLVCSRCCT